MVGERNPKSLEGEALISAVLALTGLPEDLVHRELEGHLSETLKDRSQSETTLDDLRQALLAYLETVNSDIVADTALEDSTTFLKS